MARGRRGYRQSGSDRARERLGLEGHRGTVHLLGGPRRRRGRTLTARGRATLLVLFASAVVWWSVGSPDGNSDNAFRAENQMGSAAAEVPPVPTAILERFPVSRATLEFESTDRKVFAAGLDVSNQDVKPASPSCMKAKLLVAPATAQLLCIASCAAHWRRRRDQDRARPVLRRRVRRAPD